MSITVTQFFRLTIAKKLLLGFLSVGILIILIALITLSSLRRLNEVNNRIIKRDVPLVEIADKMIEALLAQELYGRRSFILKSSEMEALFLKRSEEFRELLKQVGDLPDVSNLPIDQLATLHEAYNTLFKTGLEKGKVVASRAFPDRDRQITKKQEELIRLVKEISRDARADQNEKGLRTLSIGRSAFWITSGLSIGGLLLGVIIALTITRNISRSVNQLK